jgi:enoyl-CoA hydratase
MTGGTVRYEHAGGIAHLILDRPDKLNAITPDMVDGLNGALDRAEADDEARAVVLSGSGRAFSAGFDLEAGEWTGIANVRRELERDFQVVMRFWHCPKPTVAAVHGYCLGGAFELALACDLTVAAEDARLGEPEVRFGSGITVLLLPWVTGPKQAKELLLSGTDRLTAARACEMGLVNRVVPTGTHLDAAFELAGEIAANDTAAVRLTKRALNRSYEIMGIRAALDQGFDHAVMAELTETPESREFNRILMDEGSKAALAWRKARLGS